MDNQKTSWFFCKCLGYSRRRSRRLSHVRVVLRLATDDWNSLKNPLVSISSFTRVQFNRSMSADCSGLSCSFFIGRESRDHGSSHCNMMVELVGKGLCRNQRKYAPSPSTLLTEVKEWVHVVRRRLSWRDRHCCGTRSTITRSKHALKTSHSFSVLKTITYNEVFDMTVLYCISDKTLYERT